MFEDLVHVIEAGASVGAAVCWGATGVVGRLIVRDGPVDAAHERIRIASKWAVRAAALSAIAALADAAGALFDVIISAR